MSKAVYRYVGRGAFLMGVPARNLEAEDVAQIVEVLGISEAELEASGLYKLVGSKKGKREEVTDGTGSVS